MSNGLRSARNYDTDVLSYQTGLLCEEPTLAQQNMKEECDINVMVKRFQKSPELIPPVMPTVQDFTNSVTDFQSAMNMVRAGEEAFASLPADLREEFRNDPQRFMDFVHNPDNRDQAIKLGLISKPVDPVVPEPIMVRVVPENVDVPKTQAQYWPVGMVPAGLGHMALLDVNVPSDKNWRFYGTS